MTTVTSTTTSSRAFWTYWTASATSGLGSAVTSVALPLTAVLVLHAGAVEMGVLAAAAYVAWLVIGLPAGAIARHLPLRGLQVGADVVRALAVVSVPVAWWFDVLSMGQLVGVALVLSFADVLFFVANTTFLPSVVPRDQLQARNSLMSGTHAVTQLGGPSLGGLLVQLLGAAPALLADAVSYLASALLLHRLPEVAIESDPERTPLREQIREGWRFVTRHPVMNPLTWAATAINFVCGGQLALFAVYLVRDLDAPAGLVGFLLAAEGVGSLVGAALCPRIVRSVGSARACVLGGSVAVAGAFLIPLGAGWGGYVAFAAGNIVFAGGVVVFSTTTRTYRQVASPPILLSRVMATVRFISWGAIPVGGLLAGVVAAGIGLRETLVAYAALSLLAPLLLLASPVRTMHDFPENASTDERNLT
ncbi:MAG TPA: MFS transporter [Marmoricola sp.]|jgi:predicted MFS family arabinose efflux permease|nr:MFS transporter [Marmoricola sp.]